MTDPVAESVAGSAAGSVGGRSTDRDEARRRAVRAVRDLADAAAVADLDAASWTAIERQIRSVIGPSVGSSVGPSTVHEPTAYAKAYAATSPADGHQAPEGMPDHPIALGEAVVFPPFTCDWEDTTFVARLRFGPAYEGPPGRVHGGFVAAAFDVVVSAAASKVFELNVTRKLGVRYLRAVPTNVPLEVRATPATVAGRSVHLTCRLSDPAGRTLAKATGECVAIDASRFSGS